MDLALRRALNIQDDQLEDTPQLNSAPGIRMRYEGEFSKGLTRGVAGVSATTQAAVAQALEPFNPSAANNWFAGANETLRQTGSYSAPKVSNWDDVSMGDNFANYALGKVGEGLPSSALSLGAGGVGRILGRAGMYGAMGVTTLPQEAGEAALNLHNDPNAVQNTTAAQRLGLSLGKGAVNSVLENIPEAITLNRLAGGGARIARGVQPAFQRLGGSAIEGAIGEGATEAAQEGIGQFTQNLANPQAGYDAKQIREAAISGALPGAVIGAAGGAGQVLHSNLTPSQDEVQAVKRSVVNRLPSVDQTLTFMRTAIENPEQFGADVRGMSLDAWDNAVKAGTWAKQAASSGMDRLGSASKDFDETLATAIANTDKIHDPANRQFVMELYEGSKAKTVDSYNTLKDIVAGEGIAKAEGAGKVAAAARNTAVDTSKWLKDFYTGISTPDGKRKKSEVGLSQNDKYNLETINVTPELENVKTWLSGQDKATRNAFLKIVSTIQNGSMTREQKRELHKTMTEQGINVGSILSATRTRLGEQPEQADWLEGVNTDNTPQSQLAPNGSLGRGEVFAGATNTEDEANPEFDLGEELGVNATGMQTKSEQEDRIDPDIDHNLVQKFFQRQSMIKDKAYSVPVRVKAQYEDGSEVDPKDLYKLFKAHDMTPDKKQPLGDGKYKWVNADREFRPDEYDITEDKAAVFHLNPMSMVKESTNPANQDSVRKFLPAKGKGESDVVRAGKVFDSLMSSMLDKGFAVTMPDGRKAKASIAIDPSFKFSNNRRSQGTIVALGRNKAGQPLTYEDYARKLAKKPADIESDQGRLDRLQDLAEQLKSVGAERLLEVMKARFQNGNPTAARVLKGVYKQAADKIAKSESADSTLNKLLDLMAKLNRAGSHKTISALNRFETKTEAEEYLVGQMILQVPDAVAANELPIYLAREIKNLTDSIADNKMYKITDGINDAIMNDSENANKLIDSALAYYKDRDSESGAMFLETRDDLGLPKIKPSEVKASGLIERLEDMKRYREKLDATDMSVGHVKEHREDYLDKPSDELVGPGEQEPNDAADVVAQDARRAKADRPKKEVTPKAKPELKIQQGTRERADNAKQLDPERVAQYRKELNPKSPRVEGAMFTDEEIEALRGRLVDDNYGRKFSEQQKDAKAASDTAIDAAKEKIIAETKKRFGDKVAVVFSEALQPGVSGTYRKLSKDQQIDPSKYEGESRKEMLDRLGNDRRTALRALRRSRKDANPAQYLMDSGYGTGTEAQVLEHVQYLEETMAQVEAETKVMGVITLAADSDNLATLSNHEHLHGAFDLFFTPDERKTLVQAFTNGVVKNKMREFFKDEPAVLKRIEEDPEEAVAYGFQMYVADPDILKMGPNTKSLFQKVADWIKAVFEIMTPEQRAEIVLNDFISGRRNQRGLSPVAPVLEKNMTTKQKVLKHVKATADFLYSAFQTALSGMHDRMHATNNPAIQKIADLGYKAVGGTGKTGMVQAWEIEAKSRINDYERDMEKFSPETLKAAHDALINEVNRNTITDKDVAEAVKLHDQFLKDMLKYQQDAGVDLGVINQHYFPLQWDAESVAEKSEEFIQMLKQPKYQQYMDELMKTPQEIRDDIVSDIQRGESFDSVMGENNEPVAQSTKTRSLGFIDPADRAPFVSKDLHSTMLTYTLQAVRKAEFTRSFGKEGAVLKQLMKEAIETYGASANEQELIQDYVDGLLGNREPGMSREVKDLMGTAIVYQNWRLLPLNVFASLVDPLGIAIRSNNIGDAWQTFTYGMKNLFRDMQQRGDADKDQMEKLAEDWGIVARHGIESNVHHMYEAVALRGFNQKANELLFKYNLVNGWNKSNKIMAAAMAQRFMVRLKDGTYTGEQQQRYLEELGLSEDDIHLDENGSLLVRESDLAARGVSDAKAVEEKMRHATVTFVNQAVLNPNAAEVAGWMSNPYFALIAHLKSFVFSFQKNILGRVVQEAEKGNYSPALIATAYVPGTMAAEFVRTMISGMGEEPPWKEGWTFGDHFVYGVERSGLTGVGAFLNDMDDDIDHGGKGIESFAGPTVGQVQDAAEVVTGTRDAGSFAASSVPLAPLFRSLGD